jgi:uncharacterized Zn finger protein (UPF0148 family)
VPSLIEADHRGSSLDNHFGTPTCRECGSPLVADASGYLVCSNCGLIDEESILVTSVEEPHYHKPSLRQRKALEREEAELEAKAREGAKRASFREVQRLVEKYEERYGWRNAEAFVEKLSHRYPFLASALRRALDELRIEGRVRTKGSERARRFKQVLIDRCCRALCEAGVHPSFAVKAVREVLEELGEEGLPSYFALRLEDRVKLAEEKRRERLRAIKEARWWRSRRVARLLERIAELPGFQELDVNVLEQALRAHLGLRYREVSKKKFDLALKKIGALVKRVSVRRLVDELGFSLEEVALLKRRSLERVRRSYWIERYLKKRAEEVVARLRESFESEEAVEACLRVMRRGDPEIKVVIGHPIPPNYLRYR